jgi:O-antigen ligase
MTIEAALAITVFLFACGSSSLLVATRIGHSTRWLALFATCGLALVAVWRAARRSRVPWRRLHFAALPALFLAVTVLSATWSPNPRLTFERSMSFAVLVAAATALGIASRIDLDLRRRVLEGLAVGASAVGVAGLVMGIAGMPESRVPAAGVNPWRFQGFGQNPNTVPVLAAVALPILAWLALIGASGRTRAAWALSFVILLGTTVASQSRGGLIGAFFGVAVVLAVQIGRWPQKMGSIAALAAVIAFGIGFREATTQAPPPFVSAVQPGITPGAGGQGGGKTKTSRGSGSKTKLPTGRRGTATPLPGRADEIGHPGLSTHNVTDVGSGRVAAWLGALKLIRDRPLLGYGFGTEEIVFVDRWYFFQGARPENSVLGILLQVGVVGLLPLLAFLVILVRGGIRALRSVSETVRSAAVAPLGVLAGAVVLVFFQSWVYSVGNVAAVTAWLAFFLLGAGVAFEERDAVAP